MTAVGLRNTLAVTGTWAALVAVVLVSRPLMPLDETRYLSVAWEMWTRADFLVPYLNNAPYPHKPPLLFWIINAGWAVSGVGEWWARAVAPLFGLAGLFAAAGLFRLLWPDGAGRSRMVPWILLGCLFWAVFTTVTMFDLMNVCFAAAAAAGTLLAWRGRPWTGWTLMGIAIGLGILAKGPVILVYVLPAPLLAPWWASPKPARWGAWYGGMALAVALGAAIALSWAIPAGRAGGEAYRAAILWGQTAGRVSESFAHERPFWWYLPLVPALLFPWPFWPRAWRAMRAVWRPEDSGTRFCLAWAVPAFIVLSAISGKQPHYLLPLFVPFALMLAAHLPLPGAGEQRSLAVPSLAVVAFGVLLTGLAVWLRADAGLAEALGLEPWAREVPPVAGLLVVAAGAAAAFWPFRTPGGGVPVLAVQTVVVVIVVHALVVRPVAFAYDLKAAAEFVGAVQDRGGEVGIEGEYHGQFHFVGRLTEPLVVVPAGEVRAWLAAIPERRLVVATAKAPPAGAEADFVQPYRGRTLSIWGFAAYDAFAAP